MWALILSYLVSAVKNWRVWLTAIGAFVIVSLLALARTSGAKSAKLEQAQDWLKYQQQKAKEHASIQSMPNGTAAEQLRKRWRS